MKARVTAMQDSWKAKIASIQDKTKRAKADAQARHQRHQDKLSRFAAEQKASFAELFAQEDSPWHSSSSWDSRMIHRAAAVLSELRERDEAWTASLHGTVAAYRTAAGALTIDQAYESTRGAGSISGGLAGSLFGIVLAAMTLPLMAGASAPVIALAFVAGAVGRQHRRRSSRQRRFDVRIDRARSHQGDTSPSEVDLTRGSRSNQACMHALQRPAPRRRHSNAEAARPGLSQPGAERPSPSRQDRAAKRGGRVSLAESSSVVLAHRRRPVASRE